MVRRQPDGSGRELLAPAGTGWAYASTFPGANHVAFKRSDQISIYELPSLELLSTIQLLSFPLPVEVAKDFWRNARIDELVRTEPLHWSPDGRYLAFIAATEAPSTDVYVYDVQTDSIQRLTSDPELAGQLTWSPDSQWIVYETLTCVDEYPEGVADPDPTGCWNFDYARRAVSPSGITRKLYETQFGSEILGWTTGQSFISVVGTPNLATHTIRHVDLGTGQVSIRFRGWWWSPAVYDPIANFLVVPHQPSTVPEEYGDRGWDEGLYILTPLSDQPLMVDTSPIGDKFSMSTVDLKLEWSETLERIILSGMLCDGNDQATPAIGVDGRIECLITEQAPETDTLYWSPDGKWAVYTFGPPQLLDKSGKVILNLTRGAAYDVIWRPDTLGVFLTIDNMLAYISIPDANFFIIDDRYPVAIRNYDRPSIWVGVE